MSTTTLQWSVSQGWLAEACPFQWWLKHRFQAKPAQPEAPKRIAGRARHAALEAAFNDANSYAPDQRTGTMERTFDVAVNALTDYWLEQNPKVPPHELLRASEDIHAVLVSQPMPKAGTLIGPEHPFRLFIPYASLDLVGMIDVGFWTGEHSVRLVDWKSNTIPDTVHGNIQLAVYYYVMRSLIPHLTEVEVALYSIRQNREVADTLDPELVVHIVRTLIDQAVEVNRKANEAQRPGAEILRIFPPTPSAFACETCPFRSYCPAMSATSPPVRPGVNVAAERERLFRRLDPVTGTSPR